MRKIILSFLALAMVGCAISRKVDYDGVRLDVPSFNQSIAIATWDQREQVLAGARKPDFVGYTRSGAGIAYPMGTESGRPFADIMSNDLSVALTKKGNKASFVVTNSGDAEANILKKLVKTGKNRLLLINCKEFFTDGYGKNSLHFYLVVTVHSADGTSMAQKEFRGKWELGGSFMWGQGDYKQYMPEAFKRLVEQIFNDADIAAALKSA
jgi:hypothetical protein